MARKARVVSGQKNGPDLVTERIIKMVPPPRPMPSRMIGWSSHGPLEVRDSKPDPDLPALYREEREARCDAESTLIDLRTQNDALRKIINAKETDYLVLKFQKERVDTENAGLRTDLEWALKLLDRGT